MQADGFSEHWDYLTKRVAAAGGACLSMFAEHPLMPFSMRRQVYTSKIRSIALFGADVWGWRRATAVQKAEYKTLCILLRAHARTKPEAMLWLAVILPLWVDAAKLAYDFLISVLEFGDVLEQSAMSHWKFMCAQQQKGWYYDMVIYGSILPRHWCPT